MNKYACLLLLQCLVLGSLAQQKPHYTQYILNQYIINPAITGIENYTDIRLSHRHQWAGLKDAPVTTYFSIHTPLGKKDYRTNATSFRMPGENPRGKAYWESYTAAEPHHGIGLQVVDDRAGAYHFFQASLTYAYHIGLSAKTSLAAGFGAGINRAQLQTDKLDYGGGSTYDPAASGQDGNLNRIRPDFSAGLYLYAAEYFFGLSVRQMVPQSLSYNQSAGGTVEGKLVPHYFLSSGYRMLINEDFNLIPSVLLKFVDPLPVQADLNLKLQYQDLAWVGASYRTRDGFAGMLGINISNFLNVAYAYDYSTSRLQTVSKGTHEIMLGFLLGNKYGDWCPKNVW